MKLYRSKMIEGITRSNLLVLLLIIGTLIAFLGLVLSQQREKARQIKCKTNLRQIGCAMYTYVTEYGNGVWHPDTNGGGFLARVYQVEIIKETEIFLCPSTPDITNDKTLRSIIAEDLDTINGISYAGRKNANPMEYPGIHDSWKCVSAPYKMGIASDDWQGTPNHEQGKLLNVLFIEGEVETFRNSDICGNNYDAYAKGDSPVFLEENNLKKFYPQGFPIADPLTN